MRNPLSRLAWPLVVGSLAILPLPAWTQTARVYVTNSAGDTIDVIDPQSNRVVQVLRGVEAPHGIAFSPDGSRVYVSNEADNTLIVFDRPSGRVVKRAPLSGHPNNIAVTKDGGRVLVCIVQQPGALDVIDTKSLSRSNTIPTRAREHNVYVTPDGRYAVAGSVRDKIMTVVDLATEQVAWELKFDRGVRPMTFEPGPDGSTRRIFVQLSRLSGFAVVDFAARKEVARIEFPAELSGFGEAEERLDTPSHGIGIAPDGKTLWVTSVFANAVFAYSLPELKLIGHASLPEIQVAGRKPIGALPDWLAFTPDSQRVYVSNSGSRSVSAIDTASMKVVATIPVGEVPKRMNTLVLR
jgi:YVTN family beta-propeller protein